MTKTSIDKYSVPLRGAVLPKSAILSERGRIPSSTTFGGSDVPEIVLVHGIGQQLLGPETLGKDWSAALRDGMRAAGAPPPRLPRNSDIGVAFYGQLFRSVGKKAGGSVDYGPQDLMPGPEQDLLAEWRSAAVRRGQIPGMESQTKIWAPSLVQRALSELCRADFFSKIPEVVMIGNLKQVSLYFGDMNIRSTTKKRLIDQIDDETKIVIGHSLGSIVAYEALFELPENSIPMFITLGSPLGLLTPIFNKLNPPPKRGIGAWPTAAKAWTNVAAVNDLVAAVKCLRPLFEGSVDDRLIDNEKTMAHDVIPYLTARETGEAVITGIG